MLLQRVGGEGYCGPFPALHASCDCFFFFRYGTDQQRRGSCAWLSLCVRWVQELH